MLIPPPNQNQVEDTSSKVKEAPLDNTHRHDSSLQDNLSPLLASGWQALEFESGAEMLAVIDPNVREQKVVLHKWQVEESERLCLANPKPTSKHPFKYALCAANGSGKDAFVIAPFAVWFICCKVRSLVVITSASGVQLSNQTENYIRSFSEKVNSWAREVYGMDIIKVRKRHITCLLSGSEIFLFATDEEGKAEGYHPMEPDAEMAIIVNEAKTVPPEIFRALKRCTGYNYWVNISTPGEPIGDFYDSFEHWKNKRRVDYFDCPHQSPDEFEEDRRVLGEHSPLFRSKWLALFTFFGGKYVVNSIALDKMRKLSRIKGGIKEIKQEWPIRVGIDIALSGNGDETVLSFWRGNKQIDQVTFKSSDATIVAGNIELAFATHRLPKDHPHIFADDGGVGRAVISILNRKGWQVKRVLNNSASKNKKGFRNRGAELWFKFSRFIEACGLILKDDEKLYKQIASRKYKESEAGIDRLTLEAKKAMISQGLPSPDRADAAVLAFTDIDLHDLLDHIEIPEEKPIVRRRTAAEIEEAIWAQHYPNKVTKVKHSRFSIKAVLANRKPKFEGMI